LLAHTLDSVWQQRFTDYEVIVVDDGSSDGTHEYLKNLGDKVRVINQANRGPGAARNVGVREARGDYVAFLDSDDLWFPWTLDVFARAIQEHRNPHILGGKYVEFRDEAELLAVQEESCQTSWFADYLASSRYPYYVGSGTCVLRRDGLTSMRFLEDCLNAEDHDLILRMGTLPGFVRIIAPVTLAWRRHSGSETANYASTLSGTLRLLAREKSGVYPGGSDRSRERQQILTRYTRPLTLDCLQQGFRREGWMLYGATFGWNATLGRYKYLAGFPIVAAMSVLRPTRTEATKTRADHMPSATGSGIIGVQKWKALFKRTMRSRRPDVR
jgi:hypothetical protein